MTVIAIINPKGGCGKSTLATNVAALLASRGLEVMLGDVDRQQSARCWLGLRPEQLPKIHGWSVNENNFARPPAGVKHIVLDTPGGFHGFPLMKVTMSADAILIPMGTGLFDRQASTDYIRELKQLPRISGGKCRLACMGMRVDGRTKNAKSIELWANDQELEFLGCIHLAQTYVRCLEQGFSIFDFPADKIQQHMIEWQALSRWLDTLLAAAPASPGSVLERPRTAAPHAGTTPVMRTFRTSS